MTATVDKRGGVPADVLLRPVPILALAVLLVNDHVLKPRWPGVVTGKLSDLAGVVLLPLVLVALVEGVLFIAGRPWRATPTTVSVCVAMTVLGFILVKSSPTIGRFYGDVLGGLRWPVLGAWRNVHVTHDVTDLAVLPASVVGALDGWRAARSRRAAGSVRRGKASPG